MQNTILSTASLLKSITEHPFLAALAGIGVFIFDHVFGADQVAFSMYLLFLALLIIDWLSGTSAAKKDNIDISKYGIDGLKSTAVILTLPILARLLDTVMDTGVIIMGVITAMLARGVARSVIANVKRAQWNVYIPQSLLDWVSDELAHKDARALERLKKITEERDKE